MSETAAGRNPRRDYYFVYSRRAGRKRWTRHVPGFRSRETAERRLAEIQLHSDEPTEREYRVVDEFVEAIGD